jgi:uncharacterized protein YvpB
MKLDVPYYSQFVDIDDSFWMLRACGAVSLKMVAEFNGAKIPSVIELCNEARDRGGYHIENGWVHDYLVTKAKELGLEAYRKEGLTSIEEIIASLDAGNLVIVSVEKRVLEQKRFHIIVLTGYERSQTLADPADKIKVNVSEKTNGYPLVDNHYFYYHEPESTNKEKGKHRVCSTETFMEYWRGKAIFIKKK